MLSIFHTLVSYAMPIPSFTIRTFIGKHELWNARSVRGRPVTLTGLPPPNDYDVECEAWELLLKATPEAKFRFRENSKQL